MVSPAINASRRQFGLPSERSGHEAYHRCVRRHWMHSDRRFQSRPPKTYRHYNASEPVRTG
jgi:hypothetical protein